MAGKYPEQDMQAENNKCEGLRPKQAPRYHSPTRMSR